VKLYEEFKLVEKMWQDNLTSRIFFDKALGKKYDICKEADFRKCIEDRQYEGTDLEIAWAKLNRARRLRCTLLDYEYGRYAKEILDMAYRVKKEYEYKYNEIKAKTSNEALTESAIKTKIYKTRDNIKMSTNFAKEFKLYESMFSERKHKLTEENKANPTTMIIGRHALYEDDDGQVCNVFVRSDGLSEEEVEELLYKKGMKGVIVWDEDEAEVDTEAAANYKLGDVLEVYEVCNEDIEDVAEIAGKDPTEYDGYKFDIKGVKVIAIWDGNESDKQVLEFATFEEAAKHFDHVYVNAVEETYAEEVLYPVLDAMNNKEYDYIDDDGYAVYEQRVSTSVFESYPAKNSAITEARKNPTPPATLKIIKIEPWLQSCAGNGKSGQYRHCDDIYYIDPISNTEERDMVWEEDPGYGKYFSYQFDRSKRWNYVAYDYDGNLLPGVDPKSHLSAAIKANISKITDEVNRG
jgi:hypothetical protein